MMKIAAACLVLAPAVVQAQIAASADLNHDGLVSLHEAAVWASEQDPPVPQPVFVSAFIKLDLNKDNALNVEELNGVFGQETKAVSVHRQEDTSGLGQGSLRKALTGLAKTYIVAPKDTGNSLEFQMRAGGDLNGDGMVTLDEAKVWGRMQNPPVADDTLMQIFQHFGASNKAAAGSNQQMSLIRQGSLRKSQVETEVGAQTNAQDEALLRAETEARAAAAAKAAAEAKLRAAAKAKAEAAAEAKAAAKAEAEAKAKAKAESEATEQAESEARAEAKAKAALSTLMAQADLDNDGAVALSEAKQWVKQTFPGLDLHMVESQFPVYDMNEDGHLDMSELAQVPLKLEPAAA